MKKWLFGVLALMACESGLSRQVQLTVPASVTGAFTASAPGVIVSDLGADAGHAYTLLCGQTTSSYDLEQDLGLGCLADGHFTEGESESARVWVQPMPQSWNASQLCAARQDRSFYDATSFAPADGGTDVEPSPDSSWVQASGTGTWQRNGSPCGGNMIVKLSLTSP